MPSSVEQAVERLRATPLFGCLSDEDLQRLAVRCETVPLAGGEFLIREGDEADAMFVVLEGALEVTKRSGRAEVALARVGPGSLQGEIAALEGGRRAASVRAVGEAEVLRIPVGVIRELLANPEFALGIIRTAVERLRAMEADLRQREKLAGLGTMAAGLTHELNNPAAAIRRSISSLGKIIVERRRATAALDLPRDRLAALAAARPADSAPPLDLLTRADRTDEIVSLLERLGVAEAEEPAGALVAAGWTADEVERLLDGMPPEQAGAAAGWLAGAAAADALVAEIGMAADRISEIVGAVKDYAYLDRAPVQRIDVRRGLENTLVILRHKLRDGITVRREYADPLPEIEAYGSELNQVWTNLIDNAVDAMNGSGELSIGLAPHDPGGVRVTICDSGSGIPAEVQPRLFEPFFTTKPPGKGTGLGLHISHSVVARHGGQIEVESRPGRTCFKVTLPASLPPDRVPAADAAAASTTSG
jgi:signal transduction histidine kinase